MKNLLLIAILFIVFASCKKKYDYHITGKVIKATTSEPLEGVIVKAFREENVNHLTFQKLYMYTFHSGTDGGLVYSGTTQLNDVSLYSETEEFTIDFEPTLENVKEVELELEWNRFSETRLQNISLGPYSSKFSIESSDYLSEYDPPKYYDINVGEQWLKMNFDIFLNDNTRIQKTDSIWLPGRYYDLDDYDFGDPRKFPVYNFKY